MNGLLAGFNGLMSSRPLTNSQNSTDIYPVMPIPAPSANAFKAAWASMASINYPHGGHGS